MTGTEPSLIREWSRKAGCSPCPCSSSYHPGPRKCPHLLTSSWRLWLALTCPAFSVWTWKSLSTELNLGQQSHSLHCGHRAGPMLSSPPPPIPLLGPFSIHPSRGFNVDHPNSGRAPLKTSILHRLCDFSVTPSMAHVPGSQSWWGLPWSVPTLLFLRFCCHPQPLVVPSQSEGRPAAAGRCRPPPAAPQPLFLLSGWCKRNCGFAILTFETIIPFAPT